MKYILISIFTLFFLNSCNHNNNNSVSKEDSNAGETQKEKNDYFPYDINNPNDKIELPDYLTEISGIDIDDNGDIYAIQDEEGKMFIIKKDTILAYKFRKNGDYEGIEKVGDKIYAVKSSGTVYEVQNLGTDTQTRDDYNDYLDDAHDVEGLAYDEKNNALLLACKSSGEEEETGLRNVYQFDLNSKKIKESFYFQIKIEDIIATMKNKSENKSHEGFKELIEDKEDDLTFAPSSIAINPINDLIYITSSKGGKVLLVTNRQGDVLDLIKLDKKSHPQPEGIAFDEQGNLFISNEGKNGSKGLIYRFDLINQN